MPTGAPVESRTRSDARFACEVLGWRVLSFLSCGRLRLCAVFFDATSVPREGLHREAHIPME